MKKILCPLILIICAITLSGCGFGGSTLDGCGASPRAQGAVKDACSQVGKPYRLGGASPRQGFDCSGLIYWAYKNNGVNVPRRATDQLRAGYSVSRDESLPGDIVVFRTGLRSLHTGIYTGGNSFVHSPREGYNVRVENMTPYWNKRLVSIRRVAG